MNSLLTPEDISNCFNLLITRNPLWNNKDLYIHYIVNQTAGCFTNKKLSAKYKAILSKVISESQTNISAANLVVSKNYITTHQNHSQELTLQVVEEIQNNLNKKAEYLIISVGGDGTSLEVQTALFRLAQQDPQKAAIIRNQLTILRLPLGTGNDGTDGHSIEETINLLRSPLEFTNSPAVQVYPENQPDPNFIKECKKNPSRYNSSNSSFPWYAFNIASIGLDAYVVYMTNAVKKHLPGNFYHLCIPLSGLLYDKDLPTGTASIQFFDENQKLVNEVTKPITLVAFGSSGNRVYGGGHKILPDENNVCYAPKVPLLKLIKENHRLIDGSFLNIDLAYVNSAHKLRVYYDKPILLQCDGEVTLLTPAHFPLIFEKTEPVLRTIKLRSSEN